MRKILRRAYIEAFLNDILQSRPCLAEWHKNPAPLRSYHMIKTVCDDEFSWFFMRNVHVVFTDVDRDHGNWTSKFERDSIKWSQACVRVQGGIWYPWPCTDKSVPACLHTGHYCKC